MNGVNGMSGMSDGFDLDRWVSDWYDGWNRHDLDAVMSHVAPEVVFRSPTAERVTGHHTVRGADALREYWRTALERQPELHFTPVEVLTGPAWVLLRYRTQRGVDVGELMVLDAAGRMIEGIVAHGR